METKLPFVFECGPCPDGELEISSAPTTGRASITLWPGTGHSGTAFSARTTLSHGTPTIMNFQTPCPPSPMNSRRPWESGPWADAQRGEKAGKGGKRQELPSHRKELGSLQPIDSVSIGRGPGKGGCHLIRMACFNDVHKVIT